MFIRLIEQKKKVLDGLVINQQTHYITNTKSLMRKKKNYLKVLHTTKVLGYLAIMAMSVR